MRRPVAPGRRCWGNKEGTITVIEHHDQKQSGGGEREGLLYLILPRNSSSRKAGPQRQELRQRRGKNAPYQFVPPGLLSLSSYSTR